MKASNNLGKLFIFVLILATFFLQRKCATDRNQEDSKKEEVRLRQIQNDYLKNQMEQKEKQKRQQEYFERNLAR